MHMQSEDAVAIASILLACAHAHSSSGQLSCKYEAPVKLMRGSCDCRLFA
jgi:hypothetical protein